MGGGNLWEPKGNSGKKDKPKPVEKIPPAKPYVPKKKDKK